MSESSSAEKTEKPSAKKLKDARKKGQVVRSRDLVVALTSLALTTALGVMGASMISRLGTRVASGLSRVGDRPLASMDAAEITTLVTGDFLLLGIIVGPLLATALVVTLAGNVGQTGWVFAPEKLTLDFSRLNPGTGLKRLVPSESGIDLIKTIVGVTVISMVAVHLVREVMLDAPRIAWMSPMAAAVEGWSRLRSLLWLSGFWLVVLAGADFGLQFWRQRSSLKMTKQEVRDEGKSSEGSPEIKNRVRRVQREMSRRRMLGAVKEATVVVTNPTHFAVALQYRRDSMAAPIVVAKGQDLVAQRIRTIARESGVPIIENVSLAQALYKGTEVGDVIPGALFGAVAEVLAYLVRIKQLML
jgi:flagellar biosynthetic protein FlhB